MYVWEVKFACLFVSKCAYMAAFVARKCGYAIIRVYTFLLLYVYVHVRIALYIHVQFFVINFMPKIFICM